MDSITENTVALLEKKMKQLKEKYESDVETIKKTIDLLKSDKKIDTIKEARPPQRKSTKSPVVAKKNAPEAIKKVARGRKKAVKPEKQNGKADLSLSDQILRTITKANHFLLSSEIVDNIQGSKRLNKNDKNKLTKYAFTILSIMKKNQQLVAYQSQDSKRNKIWGLPQWVDDNKIKEEFQYKPSK